MKKATKPLLRRFFYFYCHNIDGRLLEMEAGEITEYLRSDMFIGITAAALDVPESDFVSAAPDIIAAVRAGA